MNNETKEVLLFTYYWPPSGGAGVQRWLKFCKYLPQFGVQVKVITVDEKHASYPVTDLTFGKDIAADLHIIKTKSFEPLNFYQKLSGRKQVPFAGFANETNENWKHEISRFIRGNFFIPDARRGWNKYALKAACNLLEYKKINTIITTSPPHSTQLIGLELQQKYGLQWIADLRDPWTDIYYYGKLNHTRLAKKLDASYEKLVLEKADKIVVVSEFIKKMFLQKSPGIQPEKIHVIPNGFDEEDFELEFDKKNNEAIIIAYNGTLSSDYPIKLFIEALKLVIKNEVTSKIIMLFTGSISTEIKDFIQNQIPGNCEFNNHVSHKKSVEILMSSDINLLLIPDVSNNEGILTGKLFEYLASRNPIICLGPKNGNAAAIIEECASGITFAGSETEAIATHLSELVKSYKINGTLKIQHDRFLKYSRKNLSKEMASLIKQ